MEKQHSKHKTRNTVLFVVVLLLAVAVGFCFVPAVSYLKGRFSPAEDLVSASAPDSTALLTLTTEEVDQLIRGEVTLEQLATSSGTESSAASAPASTEAESTSASEAPAETQATSLAGEAAASSALDSTGTGQAETAGSQSTAESAQSDTPAAAGESYETEVKALIQQLYSVQARAESGLNSCIASARAEYQALPAEQRTQAKKVAICYSKAGQLSALQASCDKEVSSIVSQLRTVLSENGQSTALADQAMSTYKSQKSARYSQLMNQLYH